MKICDLNNLSNTGRKAKLKDKKKWPFVEKYNEHKAEKKKCFPFPSVIIISLCLETYATGHSADPQSVHSTRSSNG